jgi:rhodanese-related sulfurtransferase
MAPLDLTVYGPVAEPLVHIGLGFAFGFVLERAGFGSAKKLTSQFYLNDMSVLKVMFTAIVTCMVLITATTAVGAVDYEKLWVNPTFLASGIVGGLIFGAGFALGGYCPGTALVAIATLKLDALGFVVGVLGGIFTFGYSLPLVDHFFNDVTSYGRFTLGEWLGLPMPAVTALALGMALCFFAAAEAVERWMAKLKGQELERKRSVWPRMMAASLGALSLVTLLVWNPLQSTRTRSRQATVQRNISSRSVAIEAIELSDLMRDRTLATTTFDIRPESEFNRFHLLDAELLAKTELGKIVSVPEKTIKIIIAATEDEAKDAYFTLASAGVQNLYWLHDGMNAWQQMLNRGQPQGASPKHDERIASSYTHKVKRPGGGAAKSGGCGG